MKKLEQRLRRFLYLVPYVSSRPEGIPLVELAQVLGVPVAALARNVQRALYVGVPEGSPADFVDIWTTGKGASTRVFASPTRLLRRPPRLTPQEALALLLGASALHRTGVTTFDDALARAETKFRNLLHRAPSDPTKIPEPGVVLGSADSGRPDILNGLVGAAQGRRCVELDYSSVSSQRRKSIIVEPYALLNHTGAWYLLGNSLTHAESRVFVFRVERILGLRVLKESFTLPPSFDLALFKEGGLFVPGRAGTPIVLRLKGEAVRRLGHIGRSVKTNQKETRVVRFRGHPTGWLASWILRQGPQVEVLAPPTLRNQVIALAQSVTTAHDGGRPVS